MGCRGGRERWASGCDARWMIDILSICVMLMEERKR